MKGDAPFFCAWHFHCDDAVAGDEIVRQSESWNGRSESYMQMREKWAEKLSRKAA